LSPSLVLNIRLWWKFLTLVNTTAYYDWTKINAVKSFIVQALGYKKNRLNVMATFSIRSPCPKNGPKNFVTIFVNANSVSFVKMSFFPLY